MVRPAYQRLDDIAGVEYLGAVMNRDFFSRRRRAG
jgi:hypothetical protein